MSIDHDSLIEDEHESLNEPALRLLRAVRNDDDDAIRQATSDFLIEQAYGRLADWLEACSETVEQWASGNHDAEMPSADDFGIDV